MWMTMLLTCPFASIRTQTPFFKSLPIQELGNVHMTTVFQDADGWIWLGSQEGLYRYDGLLFQSVTMPDSLRHKQVTAIGETPGRIWIGYKDGSIGYIITSTALLPSLPADGSPGGETKNGIQLWQPEGGALKTKITGFADDGKGGLWIATYGEGVLCLRNNRLHRFTEASDHLTSNEIYALTRDGQGRIWAGTDGGISICSMILPGRLQIINLTKSQSGLPDEIITALATDVLGNVVIGTYDHGICLYDLSKRRITLQTPGWYSGPVNALVPYGTSEIWVGTQNEGLLCVSACNAHFRSLPEKHPLRHSKTLALYKDREGLLWDICDKGVVFKANVRYGLQEMPFAEIQSVFADHNNRIWVGTDHGLFIRENETFKTVLPESENILSMWEAPDSNIWVGTFGSGIYILKNNGETFRHLSTKEGIANGSILSISGDGDRIWLASLGGVISLKQNLEGQIEKLSYENELGSSYVYKVFCDRRKRIWFGTDGKGLVMLENNHFTYFTEAAGVALKTIYSITEDLHGNIWFSTHKDGLFKYDGKNFKRFTTDNRLHSMAITGLEVDGNGQLIVAYEDGVDLVNPDRKEHVSYCDAEIGMNGMNVNLNALCRDTIGNVWLGGRRMAMCISAYREAFLDDPRPGINSISVFLNPIDFVTRKTFLYNENYLIFNFTGLWFTDPEAVRYRYLLENYDPDWKISKDHLASYPNLPPGKYIFRVQTSEHGNFDQVPEISWAFTIEKPFWSLWWFRFLCLLAGGGLIFAIIFSREKRLRREATLKREKIESQFAALKSQINPHFLFNSFNTLIAIIEETPGTAVEYVEHLSDFYRSIIVYREHNLIPLEEEMEIVRNFDFLLKKRFEDGFQLTSDVKGHSGLVMPLSIQLLVENAVKHNIISTAKPLTVEIFVDANDDCVVVRNNINRKTKTESATNFGLHSLAHRYQLMGERPVVILDDDQHFIVKIPLIHR